METLPAVNSLSGPVISGNVSVTLAELDKMRSDHANAIKLAAELELKQRSIIITLRENVTGTRQVIDYLYPPNATTAGMPGYPQETKRFESFSEMKDVDVVYKNMDEVLDTLKLDATTKVQTEIDAMATARDKSEAKTVSVKKDLSDAKKTHTVAVGKYKAEIEENEETITTLTKELKECEKEYKKLSKLTDKVQDDLEVADDQNEQLYTEIDVLEEKVAKKSIWNRIFN